MIISTENRATMAAYREGRTAEQFLDDMWQRREAESPRDAKSGAGWPYQSAMAAAAAGNVTRLPAPKKASR